MGQKHTALSLQVIIGCSTLASMITTTAVPALAGKPASLYSHTPATPALQLAACWGQQPLAHCTAGKDYQPHAAAPHWSSGQTQYHKQSALLLQQPGRYRQLLAPLHW